PLDSRLLTAHSVTLSGLTPSTTYHYRVLSTDAAGNPATSGDFTFTTAAGPAPAPIPEGPLAVWDFDASSGSTTVLDSTGNNAATLRNGAAIVAGWNGSGITFDGVDDSARVSRTASLETA